MNIDSGTATAIGNKAQVQFEIAVKLIKMNVASERAVADFVQEGSQHLRKIMSSVHPGVGGSYDFNA